MRKVKELTIKAVKAIIDAKEKSMIEVFNNEIIYGKLELTIKHTEVKEYKELIEYIYELNKDYKGIPIEYIFALEGIFVFDKFKNMEAEEEKKLLFRVSQRTNSRVLTDFEKSMLKNAEKTLNNMRYNNE